MNSGAGDTKGDDIRTGVGIGIDDGLAK